MTEDKKNIPSEENSEDKSQKEVSAEEVAEAALQQDVESKEESAQEAETEVFASEEVAEDQPQEEVSVKEVSTEVVAEDKPQQDEDIPAKDVSEDNPEKDIAAQDVAEAALQQDVETQEGSTAEVESEALSEADTEDKIESEDKAVADADSGGDTEADTKAKANAKSKAKAQTESDHDIVAGEEDEDHEDEDEDHEEEDDEHHEGAVEVPDLEPLSLEELYSLTKELIQEHPVQRIKEHVDQIKHHFFTKAKAERLDKLEAFVADGGKEEDFELEQPIRETFKQLVDTYRKERQAYMKDLEKRLNENLVAREQVIEEIKNLLQSEEKFSETFQHFRELQEKWRSIGPVPRAQNSEIWRTYHHHVENFYDYLRLNDELRDLDFKKNLEHKKQLIARAKELVAMENVHEAFKKLQKLHKEWKEQGGPVAKEHRDTTWDEFSELTKQIHDKRHAHYDELQEHWEENLKLREKICEKIEEASRAELKSHGKWQAKIKEVRAYAEAFRAAGRVPKGKSSEIWNRFREALRLFNHAKNEFYKELKDKYKGNLEDRKKLIDAAEAIKDSDDWKGTAEKLKRLQRDWKKIGPVAHADNQKTWRRFHDACDHFFTKRKEHFAEQDKEYEDNYAAKEKLMSELEAYEPGANAGEAVAKLKEFMAQWREIGFVPRSKMGIDKNWKQLVDMKFDQLKLSGKEKSSARFKNKIEILAAKGGRDLNREKSQLKRDLNSAQDELRTLEANIQMLSPTGNKDNPLVAQVEKSIAAQKDKIQKLKDKMKLIREVEKSEGSK